jgi:predicted amidohydrolase
VAKPARIRIAAAQYPIERLADLGAWEAKITRWAEEAAGMGADLVVFPEYGAMEVAGTMGDAVAGDLAASLEAVAREMPRLEAHCVGLARRLGIHILAPSGPVRRNDGRCANAASLIAPSGRVGVQEKLILTPFELNWGIAPGAGLQVFETALGRIGVLVCYDCEFPLLARAQKEAGARLLLVPSCTERVSGYNRVRTGAMARALENAVVTVQSPTVGDAPWSPAVDRNSGAAGIYVPAEAGVSDTGIIAEGRLNAAELVVGDVDVEALAQLSVTGEMRNAADWGLQPGAAPALPAACVADLQ